MLNSAVDGNANITKQNILTNSKGTETIWWISAMHAIIALSVDTLLSFLCEKIYDINER